MASNQNFEFAKCDDTKECRNGSWRTNRNTYQRSGIDGNWRTKCVDNPERGNTQKSSTSTRDNKGDPGNFRHEEIYSKSEISGCWRILSHKWKESKDVWNAVGELHIEKPHLFPVPPRRWSFKRTRDTEFIESFTSTTCNKAEIKEAADAIREKVSFPFVMMYVEAPIEMHKLQKYQHTPENEFYEVVKNNLWTIALSDDSPVSSEKDKSSNEDLKCENSLTAGVKTLDALWKYDSLARASTTNKVLLPSEVMDQEYIYFPPTEDAIAKMRSRISGKWLIYVGFSLAEQDSVWTNLLPLCTEGILTGIKASTTMITDAQESMSGEAILCYTADANDMNDVKKAGDAIRSALEIKYILYYKTNAASEEGRYQKEGWFSVTSYMHTVKGSFYARDQYKRWTLTEH